MAKSATGKVIRLFARSKNATAIRLDIDTQTGPRNGYFDLYFDNENYNALYSLALAAAVNRLPLRIDTVDEIAPTEPATVDFMLIDWPT